MKWLNHLRVALLPAMTAICAGQITYLDEPVESWRSEFPATGMGNGVFVSPNGDMVVAVASSGLVRAYRPSNGEILWTYSPELKNGGIISCTSGITFAYDIDEPFLTYIVNDNIGGAFSSRVIVLSTVGAKILESTSLPGEGSSTPKVTQDGSHVVVTSNLNQTGYFSVLYLDGAAADPADPNQTLPLAPMFRYKSTHMQFNTTTPFSDVGFFHSPVEGFYQSPTNVGLGNTNDIFVWMTDTNKKVLGTNGDPIAGEAVLYFFQFPQGYQPGSNASTIGVTTTSQNINRPYQSNTRPILTNQGLSMYWAMSRGEVRTWLNRQFSNGHSNMTSLGRGDPAYIAPRAPPTLSSDPAKPMVFGVGSANLVWKSDFDLGNVITVATDNTVSSRVAITPDDMYVFYGTQSGDLFQASTANLSVRWGVGGRDSNGNITLTSIKGDIAIHPVGNMLFVPDSEAIVGLRLAAVPASAMPSASPSNLPSASIQPTGESSGQPSGMPSFNEAIDPSPTDGTSTPTKAPITTPTDNANPQPTSSPVTDPSQVESSDATGMMGTLASWTRIVALLMALVVAM